MKISRLVLLLLVLLLLVAGVAQAQDEKVLVVGHAEATDSLDPARGYSQSSSLTHQTIYEALVTFPEDSASEILPGLATDWTISEDGLTYTFNLNPAAVFSSGAPVTADDVAFSFNRMINVQSQPSSLATMVAGVAAVDGQVVITLTQPDPALLAKLAGPGFQVTEAAVVRANGGTDAADAATADSAEAWLNSNSAGSGRYILQSWEPQVQTVLVRNPNYYGAEPGYYDRIVIVNMPEAATQKAALQSGDIDMAIDITSDQVPDLQSTDGITVYQGSGNIVHFLLMNANPDVGGPMSDPKVQQAVRLALDYPGYVSLFGGTTPASVIPVGFQFAYGSDRAPTRDLDAARALMAEAGYPDGFETSLSYPVLTYQGVNMETNAQKVVADLAEIGITVNLSPGEVQVALEEYRNGLAGFAYWFWGPDFADPQNYVEFLPGMKVGGTRAQWTDERADATILGLRDRALTESDPAAREEIFHAIQDYMQQNGPFAPFLQPGVQVAYASDIQNYFWHPQWTVDLGILSSDQ